MGLDPLPDIDFNIRCGNTLVGYATEEQLEDSFSTDSSLDAMLANAELKESLTKQLQEVSQTYDLFRQRQLSVDNDASMIKQSKSKLQTSLSALNELLNKHLFGASGHVDYNDWLETHQPFHWMAEFYSIMHENKGFDIRGYFFGNSLL